MINPQPIHTIQPDGTQTWYLNGELHREDGPAILYIDGSEEWYHHDQKHRVDGPSLTRKNGGQKWSLNDVQLISSTS